MFSTSHLFQFSFFFSFSFSYSYLFFLFDKQFSFFYFFFLGLLAVSINGTMTIKIIKITEIMKITKIISKMKTGKYFFCIAFIYFSCTSILCIDILILLLSIFHHISPNSIIDIFTGIILICMKWLCGVLMSMLLSVREHSGKLPSIRFICLWPVFL